MQTAGCRVGSEGDERRRERLKENMSKYNRKHTHARIRPVFTLYAFLCSAFRCQQ